MLRKVKSNLCGIENRGSARGRSRPGAEGCHRQPACIVQLTEPTCLPTYRPWRCDLAMRPARRREPAHEPAPPLTSLTAAGSG